MGIGALIIGDEILTGKRQDKHLPHVIETLGKRGLDLDYAAFKLTVGEFAKDTYRLLYATTSFTYCGKKAPKQVKHTNFLVRVNAA